MRRRRPPSCLFIRYHLTLHPNSQLASSSGPTCTGSSQVGWLPTPPPPPPPSHSWTYLLIPPLPPSLPPPFTSISTLEHHYCFDLWWPSSPESSGPSDLPHTDCTDCPPHNVIRSEPQSLLPVSPRHNYNYIYNSAEFWPDSLSLALSIVYLNESEVRIDSDQANAGNYPPTSLD